jgi:hypothetical protein
MKAQWTIFALEVARGTSALQAYKKAYPKIKDDNGAGAAATRLMKRPEIKNEIVRVKNEIVKAAEQSAIEEIKTEKKNQFLTMAKRRDILYQIATGKKVPAFEKGKKVWRTPSDADKLKAIEIDMEITGEGWRPPEQPNSTTINGPVYNTVIRKTVFKVRNTTGKPQTFQNPENE